MNGVPGISPIPRVSSLYLFVGLGVGPLQFDHRPGEPLQGLLVIKSKSRHVPSGQDRPSEGHIRDDALEVLRVGSVVDPALEFHLVLLRLAISDELLCRANNNYNV